MRFRAQSSTHHLASNHHADRDGYVTITLRVMTIALLTLSTNSITGQATSFADETRTFINTHCLRCHGELKQEGDFRIDTL